MKRFDVGGAILLATPSVFLLYAVGDNPTYYNQDGTTDPTFDAWLLRFDVSADAPCKFEIGLAKSDKTSFVPAYAVWLVAGSQPSIDPRAIISKLAFTDPTNNKLAVRVSVPANATVHVAGSVQFGKV